MPKYYVGFGKEFKLTVDAPSPKQAAKKTLLRYLERDSAITETTLSAPDKFRVSEKGFCNWNDEDAKEFSHSEISKLLNNGENGGTLEYA